jgi:hypothetical protein
MAAFWAVFTFGGSGPALTVHGSLDLKQEIQIQIQVEVEIPIYVKNPLIVRPSELRCVERWHH